MPYMYCLYSLVHCVTLGRTRVRQGVPRRTNMPHCLFIEIQTNVIENLKIPKLHFIFYSHRLNFTIAIKGLCLGTERKNLTNI